MYTYVRTDDHSRPPTPSVCNIMNMWFGHDRNTPRELWPIYLPVKPQNRLVSVLLWPEFCQFFRIQTNTIKISPIWCQCPPILKFRLDHHTTGCWINKHGTQWACAWNASQWRVQRDGWQHLVDVVDVDQVLRVDSFFPSSLLFSGTFVVSYPLFSLLSSYSTSILFFDSLQDCKNIWQANVDKNRYFLIFEIHFLIFEIHFLIFEIHFLIFEIHFLIFKIHFLIFKIHFLILKIRTIFKY